MNSAKMEDTAEMLETVINVFATRDTTEAIANTKPMSVPATLARTELLAMISLVPINACVPKASKGKTASSTSMIVTPILAKTMAYVTIWLTVSSAPVPTVPSAYSVR